MSFRSSVLTGFAAGMILLLPATPAGDDVESSSPSPLPTPTEQAQAYAKQAGMTSCDLPENAELDDTILALPNGADGMPLRGAEVVELDFDQALESNTHDRTNIIACKN